LLVLYKKTLVEALKIREDFRERISLYTMVIVVVVIIIVIIRKIRKKSKLEGKELLLYIIT
jgi:hypothetical protein